MTHTRIGRIGEQLAARHLESAGLAILARNWRCAQGPLRGEIDLVARQERTVVFCEVKTRRAADPDEALEAVTPRKQVQIRRLAAVWLAEAAAGTDVRFDVVSVSWPRGGGRCHIVHVPGAF